MTPTRRTALVLLLLLAVLAPARARPAAADDSACPGCRVAGGPGEYVGALLIPPGSGPDPSGLPGVAARCDGCVWTLEPACQTPGATGGVICPGALRACPPPQLRVALLLQRPGTAVAIRVGTFCYDGTVALQPAALVPGVRDRFVQLLPPLQASFQPRGVGIVNVPVLFAAGQAGSLGRPRFTLAGHVVDLAATASWTWSYGDGGSGWFAVPGGGWPDTAVAHRYSSPGTFTVAVTTTWQGQFWVDGTGPFAVAGAPVTQRVLLSVPVRAAHAELIGTG